jgi:Uma2 family endonuclease
MAESWQELIFENPPAPGRELSLEEWLDLDEDEEGEFVDGHLAEEEVPDLTHEVSVSWLIQTIGAWLSGKGFVIGSDAKMVISPRRGRKPDLIVFLPGSAPPPRHGPLRAPPDIVAEVVTPTPRDERRDRIDKMGEYAEFGVRQYWLLDPALGSFEVFALTPAGTYARLLAASEGKIEGIPGCEGLCIDLDALWHELARLGE